jgi:hypothetical protein
MNPSRWLLLCLVPLFLSSSQEIDETCRSQQSSGYLKYIVHTTDKSSEAISVKFRSLVYRDMTMWYDDGGTDGVFQGTLKFTQETTITSYPGHKFFFKYSSPRDSKTIIATVEISSSKVSSSTAVALT